MDFRFAFWNCAMSSPGQKDMQSPANMADAVEVITDLFMMKKIFFLAFYEVNKDSFEYILKALGELGLSLSAQFMPDKTSTGSEFDIGYFYDATQVDVQPGLAHTGRLGTSSVKIAQQLLMVA